MDLYWDAFSSQIASFGDTFSRMVQGNHTSQAAVYQGLPVRWWRPRTAHEAEMYQASTMGAPLLGQGDNQKSQCKVVVPDPNLDPRLSVAAKAATDAKWEAAREAKAAADATAAASRAESARQYNPAVHGANNYGLGADGNQSYDSGQGFGTNATSGGPVSNKTGKGRTDYMEGGRIGYFFGGLAARGMKR